MLYLSFDKQIFMKGVPVINIGKCPKCEKTISSVKIEAVDGLIGFQKKYHCVSYLCPSCSTVLSAQIDPIAIQTDTVNAIKKGR